MSGLIFNGNGDVIKAVDGSLTVEGLDFGGGNVNAGIVTGTSANFTGNVSVGGVLTYEDVKNVDSVGIVTARGGLNVTANTDTDTLNVSGISTFASHTLYSDGARAKFGASSDIQVYHDSGSNYIKLGVIGSTLKLEGTAETLATFTDDGSCALKYNNGTKFETTSTGASISGLLAVSGSTSETSTFTGNGVQISHASGSTIFIGTQSGTDAKIAVTNNAPLHFRTNNTERLRITSAGAIQVNGGTVHLDANGELAVFETDTNLAFTNSSKLCFDFSSNVARIRSSVNGSATIRDIGIYTGNSERLRITSAGDVLFSGLTTKNDTRNTKGITLKSPSSISFQNFGANGSKNWRIRPDDMIGWGTLEFSVSPTTNSSTDWPDHADDVVLALQPNKDVIVKNGRLGINETSPDCLLHLTANNDRACVRLENTYDTPDNVWEIQPGISGVSNTGFCIRDITDSANRFVIDGSGNIGVDDNAPSYKLNVAGDNTASNGTGMLKGIIGVQNDTTAYGSSPTAGISFQTKYRSSPDVPLDVAAIYGGKENTSDADKDGYLGFATREEGGSGTMERMRITSSGYVTAPAKRQAAFCARVSGQLSNISTNGIVIYNTTNSGSNGYQAFDGGSNYSTSTGKFTCPVSGVYYFEAQAMTQGWSNGDSMQDLLVMKSNRGTVSNPRQRRSIFRTHAENNGYFTNSVSGLYNATAGDTVWVIVTTGCSVSNLSYSYFSGFLVG